VQAVPEGKRQDDERRAGGDERDVPDAAGRAGDDAYEPGFGFEGAPSSNAVELLGHEHQARGRTRPRPRPDCLGKGEGGHWRSVIAGEKPTCIAERGTRQGS
jgi:hypothetical protein